MRSTSRIIATGLLFGIMACFASGKQTICLGAAGDSRPVNGAGLSVSFYPQQTQVEPAECCTLQVLVDSDVDSISCMQCVITFDTSLVRLISAKEGSLFKDAQFPTFFRWEHIAPDTESVADCVLGYRSYVVPPGELASFIFQAKQNGACRVHITTMRVWDIDREELWPSVAPDAWIVIGASTDVSPVYSSKECMTNYPNPFSSHTALAVGLSGTANASDGSRMTVSIYSPVGRRVRMLFEGERLSGQSRLTWDGCDQYGDRVASGVYFAVIETRESVYTTKLVLVR